MLLAQADPLQFPPDMPWWVWVVGFPAAIIAIGCLRALWILGALDEPASIVIPDFVRNPILNLLALPFWIIASLMALVLIPILFYYFWLQPVTGLLAE